jgi:aspartyl-tRNA(Asn)/glutamyl-tRNA(Gln) amidotransferase subunit A
MEGVWLARAEAPADGVPLAVKDLFDTAGLVTTYGSPIFATNVPERTAPAVAALTSAGYALAGKTNLHEFAYGTTSENPHFGVVPNPRFPGRVAGGSSGGNAAALVLGEADAALGTDSGGSVRIPAACCGIVGFKPTYGLLSLEGCWPLGPSYDHAGPMARDVAACERILDVLVDVFAPRALESLEDVRVGIAWTEHADPLVRARVEEATALFPRRGAVRLPPLDWTAHDFMREAADVHRELFTEREADYGEDLRIKLARCLAVTDDEVEAAERKRERYRKRCLAVLDDVDVVLTPTLPCVAPEIGAGAPGDLNVRETLTRFTLPFNALGWPALALPCGRAEDGLPASVQLAGRPGEDALVLAAGRLLEAIL